MTPDDRKFELRQALDYTLPRKAFRQMFEMAAILSGRILSGLEVHYQFVLVPKFEFCQSFMTRSSTTCRNGHRRRK